jgi:hypothetical protein
MAISKITNSLKDIGNRIKASNIAEFFRALDIGSLLLAMPTTLRDQVPAANNSNLATLVVLRLPDDAKAAAVLRCSVKTGTVTGEFTPVAFGTTPATTQVAVTPAGDIAFLGTDAPTLVDVLYVPENADVIEGSFDVAANVLTLPAGVTSQGVVLLEEAAVTTGTSVGNKIVLVPGAGAPAAGQARLNLARTTVTFAGADAVTKATVKLAVRQPTSFQGALLAVSPNIG